MKGNNSQTIKYVSTNKEDFFYAFGKYICNARTAEGPEIWDTYSIIRNCLPYQNCKNCKVLLP